MNGILLVNKPEGFTSFDVIAKLRGILKIRRLGHSGTLDPMATGVLPVFVGKATKACDILPDNQKEYIAGFKLGVKTDTQDTTGEIVKESTKTATEQEVVSKLPNFLGEIYQIPPMYSAVSVDGKRLYELARKGIEIERKARKIFVNEIELLSFDNENQQGEIRILCEKGTYIRSIIDDLGEVLGTFGAMNSLVRTMSSQYRIEDCLSFEQIIKLSDSGEIEKALLPIHKVFDVYNRINLNEQQTKMYRNGIKLSLDRLGIMEKVKEQEILCVFDNDGEFLGLAKAIIDKDELKHLKNFS